MANETKYVYFFGAGQTEGNAGMRNLLGGKGANLAEMASLGLPVPQGFTITTEACTRYYDDGKQIADDIQAQVLTYIDKLEKSAGKKFGDAKNPLLVSVRSGARASMPGMMDETFDGVITEVILSDEAKEATPDGKAGADKVSGAQDSRMDANLLLKETASAPVIDGQPDEPCWETAEWSEPFLVLGAMSKDVNGLWESADSKFVQAASRTAMLYDSHALYVAVRSPFPSGMTPKAEKKTGEDIWTDDCIEFFLYPESPAGFYYQLLANANGAWQGFKYSLNGRQEPWNPEGVRVAASLHSGHFDIEVAIPFELLGCEAPEAGSLWRGNCAREGKTCGGLSTWAAVGTSFLAPDRFGKFIFGSRNAFFAKTVHRLEEQMSHLPAPAVEAEKTLSELKKELSESGEKRENWLPLHNRIRRLENQMTQAANEGKSHLVWRIDPWKNFGPDIKIPFETKEMGSVNLETAKGARAIAPFMVSNLTDRALMTNLMFLPDAKSEALTDKIRFREAAFIELNGGKMIPDPIFELPIGAMLRVEPNRTAMVWMDVDTSNLTPGTYSGTVRLYPSFSGFEQKEFKLHLRVSPVDISHVFVRTWAYGYRSPDLSGLEEYGFNTINPIPTQFYPTFDAEGKPEFPHLEKMIRGLEENGIPHEEMFLLLYLEFAQWADRKTDEGKLVKFLEPEWKKLVARDLLFLRDWLNSKGFKYDQYAFYPTDEPGHDPAVPGTKAWYAFEGGKFLRSIDPNFRLMENPHMLKDGRQKLYFEMFDILEPFYPQLNRRLIEEYRDSGREIWTYSIFEKSVTPERYRHLFWENLDAGFEGPATFYDLFAVSGQDGFNSYDSNEKHEKKVVADYGAAYRNLRTRQVTPSRRLEAWYLGLTDFKLARFCRLKLEERKKAGLNTEAEERKLAGIIQEGFRAGGDMESAGKQLLSLAEELLK